MWTGIQWKRFYESHSLFSNRNIHSIPTLTITNFGGRLTRFDNGDINSDFAKYSQTFGNDPFSKPGKLTWFEEPTRIDSGELVITDLIVAARARLESGVTYVYAIGHNARLYKIQVNNPSTYNPNYDTPVLLTTLTINSPTFKYGSSIQFYGATEQIFIFHDRGVNRINFDGTGEAYVGTLASFTLDVPRPSVNFLGKLYFGNGKNIGEIDSTLTVTSYSKLVPSFPDGTYVRDVDVSPDGNYTTIVVSRIPPADITNVLQETNSLSSTDSYFFLWNGTDTGYTAYNTQNGYLLNANTSFGPFSYTFGYDMNGSAVYEGSTKTLSLPNALSPNFGAIFSTGNLVGFAVPEYSSDVLRTSVFAYGNYDEENSKGFYRFLRYAAQGGQTNVIQIPVCLPVSNLFYGSSAAGYTNNRVGTAKIYFSAFETASGPTSGYRLYKFSTVPTGSGTAIGGIYETQTQLFSKKIKVSEVRVYGEPWVTNNAFTIDLIGSNGGTIGQGGYTFTAGTTLTVGDDMAQYNPGHQPTFALGVRITNGGTVNHTISKVELDYEFSGH